MPRASSALVATFACPICRKARCRRSKRLGIFDAHHRVDDAAQHFLRAAARRDDARAQFHQTDIGLGRGDHARAVHRDLTAAAQRQPGRSDHDRLRGVAHAHVQVLQFPDRLIEHIPHALLRADHHHEQVRAGAEVLRFVADHQPIEIGLEAVQRFDGHVHDIIIEGIHLGVEFQAGHAIAHIMEGRACVLRDNLLLFQDDHALQAV